MGGGKGVGKGKGNGEGWGCDSGGERKEWLGLDWRGFERQKSMMLEIWLGGGVCVSVRVGRKLGRVDLYTHARHKYFLTKR